MKKFISKITICLLAMLMAIGMSVPFSASAAGNSVKIYFKNTENWSKVYCYTWQGSGASGAAWPGKEMKSLGNGWFEFTYTGSKNINCVFNDNGTPKTKQTADHTPKDLAPTKAAYWFVPSSSTTQSKTGIGGGNVLTVLEAAPSDFPAAASATTATKPAATTTTKAPATTKNAKTGNTSAVPALLVISACGAGILGVSLKKKFTK